MSATASLGAGLCQPPPEAAKARDGRARCGVACGGQHEQRERDVRKLGGSSSSVTRGVTVRVTQLLTAVEFHSGQASEAALRVTCEPRPVLQAKFIPHRQVTWDLGPQATASPAGLCARPPVKKRPSANCPGRTWVLLFPVFKCLLRFVSP